MSTASGQRDAARVRVSDAAAIELVRELVATPSVSGDEQAAVAAFCTRAAAFGMRAEIDEAGNGLAHVGETDAPVHIVLLGHIDTVPGRIPVRVEGGVLHGRGSVDAKGPLCAMLVAAARAALPGHVRVSVIAAVGEETTGSPGARFVRDRLRPNACIIGEPSGWDGVTLGYKGRLVATAACTLDGAHSAGAAGSAGDALVAWWSGVLAWCEARSAGATRVFDRVQATIQEFVTDNDGLRQHASLVGGFRLPESVHPDELAVELRRSAPSGVEVRTSGHEVCCATSRNDPAVRAVSGAVRANGGTPKPKLKTGTADLNVVAPVWACPICAYGPGDSTLDHAPDERLDLGEYLRSIGVLSVALERLGEELGRADGTAPSQRDLGA